MEIHSFPSFLLVRGVSTESLAMPEKAGRSGIGGRWLRDVVAKSVA
jgi:hypothetical protein